MPCTLKAGRTFRMSMKLLGSLTFLTAIAVAAPAISQTCKSTPKNCKSLTGSKKDDCLIYNGNIQHACNIAAQNEDVNLGGKGARYNGDKKATTAAGQKQ